MDTAKKGSHTGCFTQQPSLQNGYSFGHSRFSGSQGVPPSGQLVGAIDYEKNKNC